MSVLIRALLGMAASRVGLATRAFVAVLLALARRYELVLQVIRDSPADQLGTHCGHSGPFCGPGQCITRGQCITPTIACLIQTGSSGAIHSPSELFGVGAARKGDIEATRRQKTKEKATEKYPFGNRLLP